MEKKSRGGGEVSVPLNKKEKTDPYHFEIPYSQRVLEQIYNRLSNRLKERLEFRKQFINQGIYSISDLSFGKRVCVFPAVNQQLACAKFV